jgi:tetratricopeptide (TPR) repeat protein
MTAIGAERQAPGWLRAVALGLCVAPTMLACTRLLSGDPQSANAEAARLESPLGSYLAGRYARSNRDTGAAVDFFEAALAEDPANRTLQNRTFLLMLADGKIERALALAPTLAEEPQTAAMAELLLAAQLLRQGDLAGARDRLGEPPDRGFGALLKPLFLAWIEAGLGNFEQAEKRLNELSDRDSFLPFRDFHAALILDFLGAVDPARKAYERFREANGAVTSAMLAHASFLRRHGKADEAAELYRELRAQAPENPAAARAEEALEAGGPAEPYVASVAGGIAEALFGAGGALARERGGDAALIYAYLALYLRPDFDAVRILLGEILDFDQRWNEAIAIYRTVPKSSPYYWEARIRVATDLDRIDRVDDAVAELDAIAGERSDAMVAIVALADLLRARERFEEAAKSYDRAIARVAVPQERHWALFYSRGVALERSKKWELAEADFLKALELKPDHPLVLNYLGYSWVEQGRNLDRAQAMIEKAVAQRPNDGYIVDSLGWVHYRRKNFDQAVKHLERAIELKPQDPVINDHLGDAYWQVGRRLEARFQWRHALGLKPAPKDEAVIKLKLEKGLAGLASADARQ